METLNKIIKYALLVLTFLLPIFFLPFTIFPTAINKQFLLSLFCLLIFILWLIKIVVSGRLKLSLNLQSLFVLLFIVVLGVSTAFSLSKNHSFWGMGAEPDIFFNFVLYALIFYLFANLVNSKREVYNIVLAFLFSAGLISIIFLIQSFGFSVFPWPFSKTIGFNTVGTVQALGIFLGGSLVVLVALLGSKMIEKKRMKILMMFLGVILFITIFFINFRTIWIQILLGMAVVVMGMGRYLLRGTGVGGSSEIKIKFGSQGKQTEALSPLKDLILPLTIIALALVLFFIRLPLFNVLNIPVVEVSPTYKATINIAKQALSESPKNLILGSGPGTFVYKYRLYRASMPDLLIGANLIFNQGRAAIPTLLLTTGILGLLMALIMIAVFVIGGILFYLGKKHTKEHKSPASRIQLACFAGGFYFFISWFFYPFNFTLAFAAFLMAGLWLSSLDAESSLRKAKEIVFVASPQKAFFFLLGAVILISGSIIGLFTVSQKYIGALNYTQALNLSTVPSPELDKAIAKIQRAIILDRNKDVYYQALSQVFISKAVQAQSLGDATALSTAVDSAQRTAQLATQINPQNSINWIQLGFVYENVIPFAPGADQFAIQNYQKALELDPQNPQIYFNIARTHLGMVGQIDRNLTFLAQAETPNLQQEAELRRLRKEHLEKSVDQFSKAISLNTRFTNAYYWLGYAYEQLGDKTLALQAYSSALVLDPQNVTIGAKVDELSR